MTKFSEESKIYVTIWRTMTIEEDNLKGPEIVGRAVGKFDGGS